MKSFTDLEQSKKLEEFLVPGDMSWVSDSSGKLFVRTIPANGDPEEICACWSLAALLEVLNEAIYFVMDKDANSVNLSSYKTKEWKLGIDNSDLELVTENNPVDACVAMILKLHERDLL